VNCAIRSTASGTTSGLEGSPIHSVEQITYLIFIKRLDEMQELEERKAATLGKASRAAHLSRGKGRAG